MADPRKRFTEEQKDKILQMYLAGEKCEIISLECNCTMQYPGRLAGWRGLPKRKKGSRPAIKKPANPPQAEPCPTLHAVDPNPGPVPPDYVLAERDRRMAAAYRRSPAEEWLNEPPRGYSALDKMGGQCR